MRIEIEFHEDFDLVILKVSINKEDVNLETELKFRQAIEQLKDSLIELPLEVDSARSNIF